MSNRTPAIFLCAPPDLDTDRIAAFRKELAYELKLLTGRPVELFLASDLGVGQSWQASIVNELDSANFLLPLVQPGLFTSEECREQLELFLARERALGRDDLVLPVRYIDVRGFTQDSDDELIKALASRVSFDWRGLRLAPPGQARENALNALAEQIVKAFDRVPPARPPGFAAPRELRVLVVAANPIERRSLAVEKEAQMIADIFGRSDIAGRVQVDIATTAVTLHALKLHVLAYRPHVLHFSGHGNERGEPLFLDPDNDRGKPATLRELSSRLRHIRDLRCVVLNACDSSRVAELLVHECPLVVVGMRREVDDSKARTFSGRFYKQIADHDHLQGAFDAASSAYQLETGELDPQLSRAPSIDPREIVLLPQ